MERDNHQDDLIELGSVSVDTKGDGGFYWEFRGSQTHPGLSDD